MSIEVGKKEWVGLGGEKRQLNYHSVDIALYIYFYDHIWTMLYYVNVNK